MCSFEKKNVDLIYIIGQFPNFFETYIMGEFDDSSRNFLQDYVWFSENI